MLRSRNQPLRRLRQTLLALTGGGLVLLVLALIAGILVLRASLPDYGGTRTLAGLNAPVAVARDDQGVPTLDGASRSDIARATGFTHAQERFFQMDLLRRQAAGELAGLVGEAALPVDRRHRRHRFRAHAEARFAELPLADRRLLADYTEGVNAGLSALGSRPFEYWVLRARPQPWRPEDTLLVVYAMYLQLQKDTWIEEQRRGRLAACLPRAWRTFLDPIASPWDSGLRGGRHSLPAIPVSAAPQAPVPEDREAPGYLRHARGSNQWAVSGERSPGTGALLANDMHLGLRLPNLWYRMRWTYPGDTGGVTVTGATLPGTPLMIVGSNGHLAWGFTNAYADLADWVIIDGPSPSVATPADDLPAGWQRHRETLAVRGGEDRSQTVVWSPHGPVISRTADGRPLALRWIAYDANALNLGLRHLETARAVAEALAIGRETAMPTQNLMVVDADGSLGWGPIGPLIERPHHSGRLPTLWSADQASWRPVAPRDYPRLINPADGQLWTANNRVWDNATAARFGDGGYALGLRAQRIRDILTRRPSWDAPAMLTLQRDTRSPLHAPWGAWMRATAERVYPADDAFGRALIGRLAAHSDRADPDSVAHRLIHEFRRAVAGRVLDPILATCADTGLAADYRILPRYELPLRALLRARPEHHQPLGYDDWTSLLDGALQAVVAPLDGDPDALRSHTWGQANQVQFAHPLTPFLPIPRGWLNIPPEGLPGDTHTVRMQTPVEGVTLQMIVAPGQEAMGIFQMPGGQSGHPLSPYYRAGHRAWVEGRPTPFLPGPSHQRLRLKPE